MSDFTTNKVPGSPLTSDEWNQFADIDNFINSSDQAPSNLDLNQISKGVANYIGLASIYCIDSGAADAYVFNVSSPFQKPTKLFNGLTVRGRVASANTGACTLNAFGFGAKSVKLQNGLNPGAGDITTDSDSEFTFDSLNDFWKQTSAPGTQKIVGKNAIINGDFNIWQRGTSFSSIADNTYFADRFKYAKSGAMVHDVTRSSSVPTVAEAGRKFNYSTKIDCTTIDSAIAAGDYCFVSQPIEGYNFLPIAQKTNTYSVWINSSKTGTMGVFLRNSGNDRSCVKEITINAANTWEKKTVTFPASPSAGTWNYTNGVGVELGLVLAAGSTYQAAAGSWQTGNFFSSSNQTNFCDNTANDIYITDFELVEGSIATPCQQRTIQEELELCKRYFERVQPVNFVAIGIATSSARAYFTVPWKVEKKSTPTISISSASHFSPLNGTGAPQAAFSTLNAATGDKFGVFIDIEGSSGLTAGQACPILMDSNAYIDANAEL